MAIGLENIDELEDINSSDKLFGIINKRINGKPLSYKFNFNSLSSRFFPAENLEKLKIDLDKIQNTIESKVSNVIEADYLDDNNYITKNDAKKLKAKILNDYNLSALLDQYVTYEELSVDIQETAEHAQDCATNLLSYLGIAASTSKHAVANNVGQMTITEAIGSIEIPEPEG